MVDLVGVEPRKPVAILKHVAHPPEEHRSESIVIRDVLSPHGPYAAIAPRKVVHDVPRVVRAARVQHVERIDPRQEVRKRVRDDVPLIAQHHDAVVPHPARKRTAAGPALRRRLPFSVCRGSERLMPARVFPG